MKAKACLLISVAALWTTLAAVERWIGNPFKTSKRGLPVTAQTMIEERASH